MSTLLSDFPALLFLTGARISTGGEDKFIVATQEASQFETWIAEMMNTVAVKQMEYLWQSPIGFETWAALDPIDHPLEPINLHDSVSLDSGHIVSTQRWFSGLFVQYKV